MLKDFSQKLIEIANEEKQSGDPRGIEALSQTAFGMSIALEKGLVYTAYQIFKAFEEKWPSAYNAAPSGGIDIVGVKKPFMDIEEGVWEPPQEVETFTEAGEWIEPAAEEEPGAELKGVRMGALKRRVRNVWVFTNPRGETFMFATYGSRNPTTASIWPHDAPSAERFIEAFRAGVPLDVEDVRQVQRAARAEFEMKRKGREEKHRQQSIRFWRPMRRER
jgi:hypothetical protein